jgi:coatomer protein complex subunit epsilon
MDTPDELYTLRAQYYLGHYALCLEEAKAISRRPLSNDLKIEREEFQLRAMLALKQYDKVIDAASDLSAGTQAIGIRAKYDSPSTPESSKANLLSELQVLASDPSTTATAQLIAAQTFLSQGEMTKEALQCVHAGATMEHLALSVQIYLRMDRLDLAKQTLTKMKKADEEAVLTQLCNCHVTIYSGSSQALDAVHILGSMSEQYGATVMLLNLVAVAYMAAGQYPEAESSLIDATAEGEDVDTLINLVVCYQHQGKAAEIGQVLGTIKNSYPNHSFVQGLLRVEGAFERESVKYRVAA